MHLRPNGPAQPAVTPQAQELRAEPKPATNHQHAVTPQAHAKVAPTFPAERYPDRAATDSEARQAVTPQALDGSLDRARTVAGLQGRAVFPTRPSNPVPLAAHARLATVTPQAPQRQAPADTGWASLPPGLMPEVGTFWLPLAGCVELSDCDPAGVATSHTMGCPALNR